MTDLLVTVSRLQFVATVMFQMTFPSLTVGLSLFLIGMYAIGMYAAYVVAVAGRADCLPGSRH
jgi:cytochrome bd-type quinol oxidase subunit 1